MKMNKAVRYTYKSFLTDQLQLYFNLYGGKQGWTYDYSPIINTATERILWKYGVFNPGEPIVRVKYKEQ